MLPGKVMFLNHPILKPLIDFILIWYRNVCPSCIPVCMQLIYLFICYKICIRTHVTEATDGILEEGLWTTLTKVKISLEWLQKWKGMVSKGKPSLGAGFKKGKSAQNNPPWGILVNIFWGSFWDTHLGGSFRMQTFLLSNSVPMPIA